MSITVEIEFTFITTGPSVATNHDGEPYTRTDIPEGTVLFVDCHGDVYRAREDARFLNKPYAIASFKNKRHPHKIFRDHLQVAFGDYLKIKLKGDGDLLIPLHRMTQVSPHDRALLDAPKRRLGKYD